MLCAAKIIDRHLGEQKLLEMAAFLYAGRFDAYDGTRAVKIRSIMNQIGPAGAQTMSAHRLVSLGAFRRGNKPTVLPGKKNSLSMRLSEGKQMLERKHLDEKGVLKE